MILRRSACGVVIKTLVALFASGLSYGQAVAAPWRFSFSPGPAPAGYVQFAATASFDARRGFGFTDCAPGVPAVFAVDVEEGNYDVTIRFGDAASVTSTTIKAESSRLMIEKVDTAAGQFERSSDLLIAAVALHHDAQLITLDHDFENIAKACDLRVKVLQRSTA